MYGEGKVLTVCILKTLFFQKMFFFVCFVLSCSTLSTPNLTSPVRKSNLYEKMENLGVFWDEELVVNGPQVMAFVGRKSLVTTGVVLDQAKNMGPGMKKCFLDKLMATHILKFIELCV